MSENMWCLVFCSCVSLLRMLVSALSRSLQRTWTHPFLWLHSIPWRICVTFSLSSLSLMGIGLVPSLWCCEQCCTQHRYLCMCLYSKMICNLLGIYKMNRMVFLVLDPWGITTLSFTVVELIYTPTYSVKCIFILYLPCLIEKLGIFYQQWLSCFTIFFLFV